MSRQEPETKKEPMSMFETHIARLRIINDIPKNYQAFFESKFAVALIKEGDILRSVKKVSAFLYQFIKENKELVKHTIVDTPVIVKELSEPYYGCLFKRDEKPTSSQIYKAILHILNNKTDDISKIMQIHNVIGYRIFKQTSHYTNELHPLPNIHEHHFFHPDNRGRAATLKKPRMSYSLGIVNERFFTAQLGKSELLHERAVEIFTPNYNTLFFQTLKNNHMPAVAGASGHTASLLTFAKIYGLSQDELGEYAFACFIFLTAGGNHSFYEVLAVAKLAGIEFNNNYPENVPNVIKKHPTYLALKAAFPEFLEPKEEIHPRISTSNSL